MTDTIDPFDQAASRIFAFRAAKAESLNLLRARVEVFQSEWSSVLRSLIPEANQKLEALRVCLGGPAVDGRNQWRPIIMVHLIAPGMFISGPTPKYPDLKLALADADTVRATAPPLAFERQVALTDTVSRELLASLMADFVEAALTAPSSEP